MKAIFKRELKSMFCNMTAPIFLCVSLVLVSLFTLIVNMIYGDTAFENTVSNVAFLVLLIIPILTMKSLAGEKNAKTDQLLYSLPLKMSEIVMAKFFAVLAVFGFSVLLMCFIPLILSLYGTVNFVAAYGAIFAFLLLGATIIAIGMFFSSLTENQVIAAFASFGIVILFYLMSVVVYIFPSMPVASLIALIILAIIIAIVAGNKTKSIAAGMLTGAVLIVGVVITYVIKSSLFEGLFPKMISYLSVFERMNSFSSGVFDLTSIVYYLSLVALFLFLTVQSMDKKRWN